MGEEVESSQVVFSLLKYLNHLFMYVYIIVAKFFFFNFFFFFLSLVYISLTAVFYLSDESRQQNNDFEQFPSWDNGSVHSAHFDDGNVESDEDSNTLVSQPRQVGTLVFSASASLILDVYTCCEWQVYCSSVLGIPSSF